MSKQGLGCAWGECGAWVAPSSKGRFSPRPRPRPPSPSDIPFSDNSDEPANKK